MNLSRTKWEIRRIFSFKYPDYELYKKTFELLKLIKDIPGEEKFYYVSMGKVLLKQNKYLDAKYYFLESLEYDDNFPITYYNLYKIDVCEKDFIEAYIDLFKYKEKSSENIDINLPLAMLEVCMDLNYDYNLFLKNDYSIENTSKLYIYEFKNEEAKAVYSEVINSFNNRKFKVMQRNLKRLNYLVKKYNLAVDIDPLIKISNSINEKLYSLYFEKIEEELKKEKLDSDFMEWFLISVEEGVYKAKDTLNYIDKIAKKYPYLARKALKLFNTTYSLDDYLEERNYLEGKINEQIKYLELSCQQKESYHKAIMGGRKSLKTFNFHEAMDWYLMGKYHTNHPVFDYYIGKVFFKDGNYEEAYSMLKSYAASGGEKLPKSLLYLWCIDADRRNKKGFLRTEEKTKKLVDSFDSLKEWEVKQYDPMQLADFCDDYSKRKASRLLNMKYEEFVSDNLELAEYESYSFLEKIGVIRGLYQLNRTEEADILIRNLEKTVSDKNEKDIINNEKRSKKLYVKQGKLKK